MNREEISGIVWSIIVDTVGHDDFVMSEELTASDVGGWDSLSHMSIILAIEERLSVRFKLKELSKLKNMSNLLDLIHSKLGD